VFSKPDDLARFATYVVQDEPRLLTGTVS